jgi:hypothetical protein
MVNETYWVTFEVDWVRVAALALALAGVVAWIVWMRRAGKA